MRTRHSLTAAVIALIAILVGIIISLLVGGRPSAIAQNPPPPTPTITGLDQGVKTRPQPQKITRMPAPDRPTARPSSSTRSTTATRPPTTMPPAIAPPRLGPAEVPDGADYAVAADGQTFTTTFSTLEAGRDDDQLSRTLTTTVPISGSATLMLTVSGYAFTDASTTAKLTVTANGRTSTETFRPGTDRDVLHTMTVPMRKAGPCRITIEVEVVPDPQVRDAAGYLDVLALDGRLS
jgi:hypothetical protein